MGTWGPFFAAGLALLTVGACGARTTLRLPEGCDRDGDARPCENSCGTGISRCQGRVWGSCEVPVSERSCENDCGSGVQTCSDNRWGECRVEPVSQPCENECGSGTLRCERGQWGECEVEPIFVECVTACGEGRQWCEDGAWQACDAPRPSPPVLRTTIRDFLDSHPDMELSGGGIYDGQGAVAERLDDDGKPVLIEMPWSITSAESFSQWYRNVEGVNEWTEIDLPLTETGSDEALFEYRDTMFFPIDDQLLGNQGRPHNYHFTLEAVAEFLYVGGEVFSFTGDDDLWVFINERLAIDLGGLHQSLSASVFIDDVAEEFSMQRGELYPLHVFFAERHTVSSNFQIETSIAGPPQCQ